MECVKLYIGQVWYFQLEELQQPMAIETSPSTSESLYTTYLRPLACIYQISRNKKTVNQKKAMLFAKQAKIPSKSALPPPPNSRISATE